MSFPALYAAFDRFPAPRGAATHIAKLAPALFDGCGGGLLYTLGGIDTEQGEPGAWKQEGDVGHLRLIGGPPHYLDRAGAFQRLLSEVLPTLDASLKIAQFRDPWSGLALLSWRKQAGAKAASIPLMYEVNGLPSIELPSRYPNLLPTTLEKLRTYEAQCWHGADWILTPSSTLRDNLIRLGAPAERIEVLPNGATLHAAVEPTHRHQLQPYLLYFGAVQPWQGVEGLLKAFALLQDMENLRLVMCVSASRRQKGALQGWIEGLQLQPRVHWEEDLTQPQLRPWIQHATLTVAPLTACARNLEQGCAPLKILESMAAGVPVVASDLPPVRELIRHGENGWLVRPDRPLELARAIRILLEYPEKRRSLGVEAQRHIRARYQWAGITRQYQSRVENLLQRRTTNTPDVSRMTGVES